MIYQITRNANGVLPKREWEHYHVCDMCKTESAPYECVEDAEDCEDTLCSTCIKLVICEDCKTHIAEWRKKLCFYCADIKATAHIAEQNAVHTTAW